MDEPYRLAAVPYVELNPVRAGMARSAEEYPWLSARFHLGMTNGDILVKDRNLLGLVDNWEEYLQGDDKGSQDRLLVSIRTGRPAGAEEFVKLIEKLADRDLSLGKPGRPMNRGS